MEVKTIEIESPGFKSNNGKFIVSAIVFIEEARHQDEEVVIQKLKNLETKSWYMTPVYWEHQAGVLRFRTKVEFGSMDDALVFVIVIS